MYAVAIMTGYIIALKAYKLEAKDPRHIVTFIGYQFLCSMIGARLWTVIFYEWDYFSQNLSEIFQIWKGGLSSHGAILGIFLAVYLYNRKYRAPGGLWSVDVLSIIGAFTAGFIRLGNLFNSEILGTASQQPWAFIFRNVDSIPRHPVVIYESLSYFAFAIVLWIVWKRSLRFIPGVTTGIFLAAMLTIRILLENYKLNAENTQLYSLPFIITGVIIILWSLRRRKSRRI